MNIIIFIILLAVAALLFWQSEKALAATRIADDRKILLKKVNRIAGCALALLAVISAIVGLTRSADAASGTEVEDDGYITVVSASKSYSIIKIEEDIGGGTEVTPLVLSRPISDCSGFKLYVTTKTKNLDDLKVFAANENGDWREAGVIQLKNDGNYKIDKKTYYIYKGDISFDSKIEVNKLAFVGVDGEALDIVVDLYDFS
ncbi:MAG: hypothetical protein LBN40_05635 [Oscillospiraceae bacterium]|jgi:hypothetical protein|nr:hypothetical protein [Oscillospiraceae bacterium]